MLAPPAFAAPSGRIKSLVSNKTSYLTNENVNIQLTVENNGDVELQYQAEVVITAPSGKQVFHSVEDGRVTEVNLEAGKSETVTFSWKVPTSGEAGAYTLTAALRDLRDFQKVYDARTSADNIKFDVQFRPVLAIVKTALDFGDFRPGQTPEASFSVSNAGNGTLEWKVTEWPKGWVDLVSPTAKTTNTGNVVLRVKKEPLLSQELKGTVVVSSNAGTKELLVTATLDGVVHGRIKELQVLNTAYSQGQRAVIEAEVENDGTVALDYLATFAFKDAKGQVVYRTHDGGGDIKLTLAPNATQTVSYSWMVPFEASLGKYEVYVGLRYFHDFDLIFYDLLDPSFIRNRSEEPIVGSFEVREGPHLSVTPAARDFGAITQGQTPDASITIASRGPGTLQWQVKSLPDWLELTGPQPDGSGPGNFRVRVKGGLATGSYSGAIEITSNGGNQTIALSLNVQAPPTPTSTPAPTATPVPPTATTVPPTPTPVPPTATPQPTATRVPPTSTPPPPAPPTATATRPPAPTAIAPAAPASQPPPAAPPQQQPTPKPKSGGRCGSALGPVPALTAMANMLLLLAPLGLIAGYRRLRR